MKISIMKRGYVVSEENNTVEARFSEGQINASEPSLV